MTSGVRSGWIGDYREKLYSHTMEMEQMMTHQLAEIRTNQAETDASQAKLDANIKEMRAGQQHLKEEMLAKLVHGFGGKFRRIESRWSLRRSMKKRQQWKLLEH
jgi:hypothetical protein